MRFTWTLLLLLPAFSACKKNQSCDRDAGTTVAPANERAMVTSYLAARSITATELGNSGMFYVIVNPGNNRTPNVCNNVRVRYRGELANGTVFDQTTGTTTVDFPLGQLIEGWRRGLPLIGEEGKIRLYIPPSLGYRDQAQIDSRTGFVTIPANSMLIFEIDLVRVF